MTEYFNTDQGNQNEPEVYVRVCVCVCVCLWTFLTARPDRTRRPIFMKFGTQTKMLIRYRLPEVLWDALICDVTVAFSSFFEAALWRPQFSSNFLEISVTGVKVPGHVGDCT